MFSAAVPLGRSRPVGQVAVEDHIRFPERTKTINDPICAPDTRDSSIMRREFCFVVWECIQTYTMTNAVRSVRIPAHFMHSSRKSKCSGHNKHFYWSCWRGIDQSIRALDSVRFSRPSASADSHFLLLPRQRLHLRIPIFKSLKIRVKLSASTAYQYGKAPWEALASVFAIATNDSAVCGTM